MGGVCRGLRHSHPQPSSMVQEGAGKQAELVGAEPRVSLYCAGTSVFGGRWLDAGTLEQSRVYLVEYWHFCS